LNSSQQQRAWVLEALERYEARLVRYARRLTGDEEQARDVVQFALLKLCDQSPEEIGERLALWLYTVCNLVSAGGGGRSSAYGHGGHSPPYSAAERAERAEMHAMLRALVECLPASQREAIDLWAEGFSYVEIGRIVGKQEGHVRVLVHRGLKAIREHPQVRALMEDEPGGGEREQGRGGQGPRMGRMAEVFAEREAPWTGLEGTKVLFRWVTRRERRG
jgi:RNA polymerase sigma-70 factor (ECF subfamily)